MSRGQWPRKQLKLSIASLGKLNARHVAHGHERQQTELCTTLPHLPNSSLANAHPPHMMLMATNSCTKLRMGLHTAGRVTNTDSSTCAAKIVVGKSAWGAQPRVHGVRRG